ncbi:uncharacterized protein LOC129720339 [Wyeomyia smithii]|uniref:uncharacterized protein LOC129720339 n=1 Tax=Wyeomyia smithii TaxID=174621 RepID=UPI0024681776|nr:uncharacterized protein LOC129720339 [Wyeomyia smithii]
MAPPHMERLETLIDFGVELQGLCDPLQASGEIAHLNNPSLLQELEDKLPTSLKLQWGMQKQINPNVTLQTFADYMSQMVTAASHVTKLVNRFNDRRLGDRRNNNKSKEKVLLNTHSSFPVTLRSKSATVNTFAFLDDGSSLTLVEQSVAHELGVTGPTELLYLKWTGDVTRCESDSKEISLELSGLAGTKFDGIQSARTVSELKLPVQSLDPFSLAQQYPHFKGLPISRYENALPRVLIGLDQVNLSLSLKCREGRLGEPVATKTRLGWCVHGGGRNGILKPIGVCCYVSDTRADNELHDLVKMHFEIDDIGTKPLMELESVDDTRAKNILRDTTKRTDGRLETGLLWRYDQFEFPESYHMALRRLECLERRMSRDPALKQNVHQQIQDYQSNGYAHRATDEEFVAADPRRCWYLPLGIVTHPKKPGKVRLIWDAAAKVDGISLNALLLKGPDLLSSLSGISIRFREKPIAISGDIRQMFHKIRIRPEDRHAERFLWREDTTKKPDVFLNDVATFGSSCSPCSAQYIKNKNAEEYAAEFPRAAEAVVKCHYVDDLLDSFDTKEEAMQVAAEVKLIHSRGGFDIRGWRSNSPAVLRHLGETVVPAVKNLDLEKGDGACCGYLPKTNWLSQFKCGWDQEIGDEAFDLWRKWTDNLCHIDNIRLPRCFIGRNPSGSIRSIQLHTFVDASEEAYSTAAYYRIIFADGTISCVLISAKAKIAPLTPLSILRLELRAAVRGARLASFVGDNHTYAIDKRIFWSDASTVLAWIRSDARRYRQYVSCRIGEILTLTETQEWKWVPTKMNTADEATKWGHGPCLSPEKEWFRGPTFLQYPEQQWPIQKSNVKFETVEELRSCFVHNVIIRKPIIKFERFSLWVRLVRSVTWMSTVS